MICIKREGDSVLKLKEVLDRSYELPIDYLWAENNIKVRRYIPIEEKYEKIEEISLENITNDSTKQYISIDTFVRNELIRKIVILLHYTNIEYDKGDINYDTYDSIMDSDLYSYINNNCRHDYEEFLRLYDEVQNTQIYSLIMQIEKMMKMFGFSTDNGAESMVDQMKSIDPVIIEKLTALMRFNNPSIPDTPLVEGV